MNYVLGIDFGGGSSKATLLSRDGRIVATNTYEYQTFYPENGYVEQNPEDWYIATKENIKSVLAKSGIDPAEIAAISLDAATHTAVLMDEEFQVLMPAIYWTDTRSVNQVRELQEEHLELILEKNLHTPDTIWTLPQLMWVREHRKDIWQRVRKILFAKDYVRHQLTGDYLTDVIEAEGSMLFDYHHKVWSQELCNILGISTSILPKVVKPMDVAGYVTEQAAEETGLVAGTKVLCGTTDTAMEIFAAGAVSPGQMTVKLATAGRICTVTEQAYSFPGIINYSHILDGCWYPGTGTKSCAASYRWYRDTFGEEYQELDAKAEKIAPGCDGLLFHPYLNGELTPYADPSLCGSFIGIRAGHTKAHFTRAVLEGVALSLLDCLKTIENLGIQRGNSATVIGGGGKSPLWRQITADVLGLELVVKKQTDSSFGSAMLAGISGGFWESPESAVNACNETIEVVRPNEENHQFYERVFHTYQQVHHALAPIYHQEDRGK